jgi:hypothetical protein
MEEDTTTDVAPVEPNGPQIINGVAVDDQGQAIPVQEDTEQSETAGEAPASEPEVPQEQTETTEAEEPAAPEVDDKLKRYAESQGIELDSPGAIKAAKIALKNQSDTTKQYRQASELEQSMQQMSDESAEQVAQATGENPEVLKRLQRMEVKNSINDFWAQNPDARKYETQMTEIATTAGLYGTPDAIMKAAYAMARAADSDNLERQGGQKALQNLAAKQQAAVPRGNAVSSAPSSQPTITPQNVDMLVGQHDHQWYMDHRDEINRAMAG